MKRTKLTTRGIAAAWLVLGGFNNLLATDRHVPADYATIQAAVNAAVSGDTIHIAPGVYVEQTFITNKNLTLIGQPGTILRAFPGMLPALPPVDNQRCILRIDDFSFVTIRDLTFEGDQLAGQNAPALIGVNYDLSGGSVENCRFTGFREKTPGTAGGLAIKFWNGYSYASRYPATVSGTTIEDSYSGIAILGTLDAISYDVTVVDNTITGVGLTTAGAGLKGLEMRDGITGVVARNTIIGFAFHGPVGPTGSHPLTYGIVGLGSGFLPMPPMTIEDNVLRSNQVHLAYFKADDSVVRNNTLEGNFPVDGNPPHLERAAGLWFSGDNVQVIGNQFRDLEQGIRLSGGDPFGIATNAMLIDNRVCNVVTNIVAETGASYTEQGTLTCPFPAPTLKILSWPGIEEGFSVQSAPTPSGPWSTLDVTPIRQNGHNNAVVPAAGEQQFFRLTKP